MTHDHDHPALDFTVDALAVWRMTRLVTEDTIFDKPRDWVLENGPEKLADLISCNHCSSVWLGAGAVLARTVVPTVWIPLSRLLALSAVTSLKTEITETFGS